MNPENVQVVSGIYCESLPLAGMTVEQVRRTLTERLDIAPDATPVIDGVEVDGATVLTAGQTLAFVRRAGEMG